MPEHDPSLENGITLSWTQFGIGLVSFVVSLVTPLLVFVNQTNVNIAVISERLTQQTAILQRSVIQISKMEMKLAQLDRSLYRIEMSTRKGGASWD